LFDKDANTNIENVSAVFSDWRISGSKISYNAAQTFGPICFAQYTVHKNILKLTAQLTPIESIAGHKIVLQTKQNNTWKTIQENEIDPKGRCVNFRIENWKSASKVPYRIKLHVPLRSEAKQYYYEGTIAPEPVTSPKLKVAVFSCNGDYGFPDAEVAPNVQKHKPDIAVFLGDQFYESHGGFDIQTFPLEKSILDYLRKWYMFGWSYRDIFRHIPCTIIPDDHDVYHGNVWGEGGKHAPSDLGWDYRAQDLGGYKMPAAWVNMIQHTQTSHLPDPYDPTPVKQGIRVYYTNWNYAGVSFAILEDRKFKSAPKNVLPSEAKINNGFIQNPAFDIKEHRDIDAVLLGERQMKFLNDWSSDWKGGVEMKCVLSQTNLCTVATLPKGSITDAIVPGLPIPELGEYIGGDWPTCDMDSNGWPQKGRDEAIKTIRKCFAFHIAGDQHIASMVHYGVDAFGDSGYAFAGPALNNIFPRRWWPPLNDHQSLPGKAAYTGNFFDGFGNRMTVHAVANPRKTRHEPAIVYDRATGYGIVTFDKAKRTIHVECWPRYVDPDNNINGQYKGWPITIKQEQNYNRKAVAWLPTIKVNGISNPVIEVVDERTGELVYSVRIKGKIFKPKTFAEGRYTIRISDPDKPVMKERKNVQARSSNKNSILFSV
jgi:alkaline phosphatase D